MRSFLKSAARWLGVSIAVPRRPTRSVVHRIVTVEPLEDRNLLSAAPVPSLGATSIGPMADVAPLAAPAAAAPTGFINAVYQDVLNRAPDQFGLSFYTKLLNSGAAPISVVTSIWQSAEHRGIEVDGFYKTFFHRTADPLGRQAWVNILLKGTSEESVMFDFLISPEYQRLNALSQPFVTALYHDVLGRAPDAPGLATFVSVLQNHTATPANVVQSFVNSHEVHLNEVNAFYTKFLQRAPDVAGQAFWAQQLDQAIENEQFVAETFLSSQEYINLHPFF
jgi:Domain of unknown function (DUF4214)